MSNLSFIFRNLFNIKGNIFVKLFGYGYPQNKSNYSNMLKNWETKPKNCKVEKGHVECSNISVSRPLKYKEKKKEKKTKTLMM